MRKRSASYKTYHRNYNQSYMKAWRKKNPLYDKKSRRIRDRRRKYGMSKDLFEYLVEKQGNKCVICQEPETTNKGELSVDHDHKTGKIRGLLCSRCNIGIGYFRDNSMLLGKASEYLQSQSDT